MLFNDGTISTIEDLTAQDASLLDVAAVEGVDVSRKAGLAKEEIALDLQLMLAEGTSLDQVAVTSPLRMWHTFHTLALVYRDVYYAQLNDRYKEKWREYAELAKWAWQKLTQIGVGIVGDPVPQAAQPEVLPVQSPQPAASYWVCIAWVNSAGEEGAPSPALAVNVAEGNSIQVRAVQPPPNATGWNVFVGHSPDEMWLQNDAPVPVGAVWIHVKPFLAVGREPGTGQLATFVRAMPQVFLRG